MSPVLNKSDFVKRYRTGEFGNCSPTWNTPQELEASGYTGLVHLRNKVATGKTYYDLKPQVALHKWLELGTVFYCSAMAPHYWNVIQGEMQVVPYAGGLQLTYSTVPDLPMREALAKQTHHSRGIIASSLLKRCLCSNSYEWLQYLLMEYPGHVVEFSTFSRNWGTLPHHNTVFWEVRLY